MSERDSALATLQAVASSPDAIATSQAHLFAGVDALVATFIACTPSDLPERQRSLRSPTAVWNAIYAHAENRIQNLKRAEAAKAAK